MKYKMVVLAVADIEKSKKFYYEIFGQKVICDFGKNVTLSGGFSLQEDFSMLTNIPKEEIMSKSNNMELYFESNDIEKFYDKLKCYDIKYVHKLKMHDWKQRVIRIYDPDYHIIEIGESMKVVINRYLNMGYSVEETARITEHPVPFVNNIKASLK